MKALAHALALLALLFAAPALAADPQFPPLTGRVVDNAHVLSPATAAALTDKLAALEQKNSRQLVVVTLPTLNGDDIEDYSNRLLRHWGIGQKATNNGALFVVVPSEHKVRIEVGYGLEPILTDALSSVILQRAVLPKFRAGDVQGGIVGGTDAIIDQLSLDPSAAEAKAAAAAAAANAPAEERRSPLGFILPLFFFIFIAFGLRRGAGWLLPALILGGSRGGWGGGGGGGFGGGGGGFGGGGGSSGGGGASGGW